MNSTITNKNRQITYQELVDSHFMKHPSHSHIVHTIFNPFIIVAIILVATTMYVKIVDGDWVYAIIVGAVCSMFLSMKMAMVTMRMNGHGVEMIEKGKLSLLGLPSAVVVMFTIIFSLLVALTYIGYTAPGGGFERVQMLGTSMLFGFTLSVLSWRFHSYYETWYGSEYIARFEFKNKGNSDEIIEMKIKKLKKMGVLL